MATVSEDVLQQVSHVRHKKKDGVLYVMPERIAWMPNGKDKIDFSVKYFDIKSQKISPEGKPKIQLQLVLNSGDTHTFHFVHRDGSRQQLKDRDEVKELLQQLLPKFSKKKLTKDMEAKQKILVENPELLQLYQDLVTTDVITSDEFWTVVAPSRLKFDGKSFAKSMSELLGEKNSDGTFAQPVGISPDFLSGREKSDGCNGITYNITKDFIDAVFKTYPGVKKKHFENVPHIMSENEFWSRFFQSHYYHRDRVILPTASKTDIFVDCAKEDERYMRQATKEDIDNFFLDLTSIEDVNPDSVLSILEVHEEKSSKKKDRDSAPVLNPNQALIKRFNQHSIMILDACTKRSNATKPSTTPTKKDGGDSDIVNDRLKRKHDLIEEKTSYEDLVGGNDVNDWLTVESRPLDISDKQRYMVGPRSASSDEINPQELTKALKNQGNYLSNYKPSPQCLSSEAALIALRDLSPGGAHFKLLHSTNSSISLKDTLPKETQEELVSIYNSLNELLRHFWSCFPVVNDTLDLKAANMKQSLEKFEYKILQPFIAKLQSNHMETELARHLRSQLHRALTRYNSWQAKKPLLQKTISRSNPSSFSNSNQFHN